MTLLRPSTIALMATALTAVAPLRAEEARFGVRSEVAWDDNLFSTADDAAAEPTDDWSLRVSPFLEVEDPDGGLQWEFRYRPAWEGFLDTEDIDGWDHSVSGSLEWRVTPTTRVEVSDTFARFQSISRFNETIEDDFGQVVTETLARRTRFKRNDFSVGLSHQLTPDQVVSASFQHFLLDFPQEGQDRQVTGLSLRYRREVTERLAAGVTGGWRRQIFEGVGEADDRETDFFNVSGLVEYRFDPTFQVTASLGPSLVDADRTAGFPETFSNQVRFPQLRTEQGTRAIDPTTCPTTDGGETFLSAECETLPFGVASDRVDLPFQGAEDDDQDSRLTFFADVAMTKRWEQWTLRLSYRRRDDTSSSFGTSTISDVVNLNLNWRPSPRWSFALGGAWIRQEQSTEALQPVLLVRPLSTTASVPIGNNLVFVVPPGTGEAFAVGTIEAENDFEQRNVVVSGSASYRLTRRITLFARAFYVHVTREGLGVVSGDFDRFTTSVGVTYEFEPIRF